MKVLIVGLGSIAKKHIINLRNLYPLITIYVVSSSGKTTSSNIEQVNFCKDISEAIKYSPDFAIIASPSTYHFDHAQILLRALIPVLIEKPLTENTEQAEQLVNLAAEVQIPIQIGYCLRYLSSTVFIKKILDEGVIGPIYNVKAHVGQFLPLWRNDKHYRDSVSASSLLGGGVLLELSHEFDYLQWLLGKLTYQYSFLRNTHELDLEVEEIADVLLTAKNGAVCTIHMNFIQKTTERYCSFIGKNGHLDWNLLHNTITLHSKELKKTLFDESSLDNNSMYSLMLQDFVGQVRMKRVNHESIISAYETVKLIAQIKKEAVWGIKQ